MGMVVTLFMELAIVSISVLNYSFFNFSSFFIVSSLNPDEISVFILTYLLL